MYRFDFATKHIDEWGGLHRIDGKPSNAFFFILDRIWTRQEKRHEDHEYPIFWSETLEYLENLED